MSEHGVTDLLEELPGVPVPKARRSPRRVQDLTQRGSLIIAWIVVIIIFGALRPTDYLSIANFSSIFGSEAVLAVLALGLIVALRAGVYDLSIAATMTVSSVVLAQLNATHHWNIVPAMVIAVLVGLVVGFANAFCVILLGIDSFIATLGIGTVLQGVALWITGGETISGVSGSLTHYVVLDSFLGIPLEFYYSLILMVLLWYAFHYTVTGRRLLYVGKSIEVARLSGIRVKGTQLLAFVVAAVIAAAAGVMFVGTSGSADPTSGLSDLLPAYAAAFLGATAIEIGEFNPVGTIVAVYFLVSGIAGLAIMGVATFVQQLFYGGALIIAVAGSRFAGRRRRERAARAE